AAVLIRLPPAFVGSLRYKGTPDTKSGRVMNLIPNSGGVFATRSTGVAVRALKIASNDQLPRNLPAKPDSAGLGMSYVRAPEKPCRTSKSDGPRSILGFSSSVGTVRVDSKDAISIECAHVYEASACRPRDKRR